MRRDFSVLSVSEIESIGEKDMARLLVIQFVNVFSCSGMRPGCAELPCHSACSPISAASALRSVDLDVGSL